jgi:hypothetical protein
MNAFRVTGEFDIFVRPIGRSNKLSLSRRRGPLRLRPTSAPDFKHPKRHSESDTSSELSKSGSHELRLKVLLVNGFFCPKRVESG